MELVKLLCKYNADVNIPDRYWKQTPLHLAVWRGQLEIVKLLLERGANVNAKDEYYGETPLHISARKDQLKVVKFLLQCGADINAKPRNGTLLRNAFFSGERRSPEVIKLLIQHTLAQDHKAEKPDYLKGEYSIYWNKCHDEIEETQKHKIGKNEISFFDVLVANENDLAFYMSDKNVVQVLTTSNYGKQFSYVADRIESQYKRGIERKNLLCIAEMIIKNLTTFNDKDKGIILDSGHIRKLAMSLSNQDIRNLKSFAKEKFTQTDAATQLADDAKEHACKTVGTSHKPAEHDDAVSGCFGSIKMKKHSKCIIL